MSEVQRNLVIPMVLQGDNYLLWSSTSRVAINSKGLWHHIESERPMSFKDKEEEGKLSSEDKWFQEDQIVLGAIQSALDISILQAYHYCKTAKDLWDTLQTVYGDTSNLTRIYEVKKAINRLHQEDMEFKKYFGQYRSLWSELEMLRPTTTDPKELNIRKEQDKVFGLLLNLNPIYNDLVKHILRGEKLPTLDEVCHQIQKETGSYVLFTKDQLPTAHKVEAKKEEEEPVANKANYKGQGRGKPPVCQHCKKLGHTKNTCWNLHPHLRNQGSGNYQDNYNNQSSSNYRGNNNNNYREQPRANFGEASNGPGRNEEGGITLKKSDLEALIQSITKLNSGISHFSKISDDHIIVDSGASHHMINNAKFLDDIRPSLGRVKIANGDYVRIMGVGSLNLFDKKTDAFYLPNFTSNLLSVKRVTNDLNCNAIFSPNDVKFQDIKSGKIIGSGGTTDELYTLKNFNSSNLVDSDFSHMANSVDVEVLDALWHARLGHPHSRALEILFPSLKFDNSRCEACILGKHCKNVFPHSQTIYENAFDLIHSDVWQSPCVARDNSKYFVTFIDEKSKYTWITLLPSKDRVFEAFQNFQNHVSNQFNAKIKIFRSDNGGEYMSQTFKDHLAKHGIIHQTTCPYTPQQNGVAERKNRHLMEVARSMMFHGNVPKRYWGDAVMTACYLINRIPTKVLNDLTPWEVINKTKPFLNHLKVFGCVCFVLDNGVGKTKLDAKSIKCVFLGYSITQKGYKCFDPTTNKTYVSRDVKFFEEQNYFKNKDWENLKNLSDGSVDRARSLRILLEQLGVSGFSPSSPSDHPTTGATSSTTPEANPPNGEANAQGQKPTEPHQVPSPNRTGTNQVIEENRVSPSGSIDPNVQIDRSQSCTGATQLPDNSRTGATQLPDNSRTGATQLPDNSCTGKDQLPSSSQTAPGSIDPSGGSVDPRCQTSPLRSQTSPQDRSIRNQGTVDPQTRPVDPPPPRRSSRIKSHPDSWKNKRVYYNANAVAHPIQEVCSLDLLPEEFRAFLSKIEEHHIPHTYEEAHGHEVWDNAVDEEIGAMLRNHTWDEEDLPKGKKCVTSRWVFTIKYKSNGEIERYKARLVARGFTQTYGQDYTDTFAPVAKQHTVKVVLSLAVNLDWDLWQMDVKNAFLQGELKEEVYMTPPPGLEHMVTKGKVLRLRKAIYGLKQSPRAWYHKLGHVLKGQGFRKSEADHTLFTKQDDQGIVVVLVYVDDLIITGSNTEGVKGIKQSLHDAFDIKDLGELKYFLGIEVCRSPEGLFLSQRKYTLDLLDCVGKLGAKAATTPLEPGYKVNRKGEKDDRPFEDVHQYRRMVGKLIYLTYTRPDISFAVNQVSQRMKAPTKYDWSLVERILRYLKGTPGQGIWMGKNKNTEIVGYCDADWCGDRNDRKSTTGYCTFIGGNLVTWKSKKQKVVSSSSAEAEYRAMRKLLDEMNWLKYILEDLGVKTKDPMMMHADNQSALHIANNSVFHERTKHIEADCHKVRNALEDGVISTCFTPSKDQLADIFTKATSIRVSEHIHKKLGLVDLTRP